MMLDRLQLDFVLVTNDVFHGCAAAAESSTHVSSLLARVSQAEAEAVIVSRLHNN